MVTIAEICDGIANTLSTASGIKTTKSYDQLSEGIPATDCPRLQVYPDSFVQDVRQATDRTAFSGSIRQSQLTIFVDVYARQRSHLALDVAAMVDTLDSLIDVLEAEERPPFFGVKGVRSFRWEWRRAVLRYGDKRYSGGRFTLWLQIY